ncbi:MAG: MFS transporter [Chloroflexota bacterium]
MRDFRLLWTGGLMTHISDWMDQVTLSWLVLEITGSPVLVGLLHGCRFLPLLVFGLWGGVLADRFDRKTLLIRTQMASLLVTLGLATVAFQESPNVVLVFIFAIARGSLLSFDRPSRHALMPALVPKPLLMNAVALSSASHNISRVIGPALAGVLIAVMGVSWCILLTGLIFIPNLIALFAMRVPPLVAHAKRESQDGGILEALQYARQESSVAAVLGTTMLLLILVVPHHSMLPVFARDVLLVGPAEFGALNAAAGIGSLVGTMSVAWLGQAAIRGTVMIGGALAYAVAVIGFSVSSWYPVAVVLLMITGACSQMFFTTSTAVLQTIVPDRLRGRIMSIYLLDRAVMPIGSVIAGAIAAAWGAPLALGLLAGIGIVAILLVAALVPALRAIGTDSRTTPVLHS